ncbi:serine/threonine-protein kinase [Amycolatopsis benzoatilytica]|uniref:serine/threonine-protein kinase n=1 Tax=Amycolatopsis benzoatilytica TaxID=346045 RepID=UPI00035DF115
MPSENSDLDQPGNADSTGSAAPEPSAGGDQPRVVAGRYRLRSVLGSGSMGTVWSAYDEFLHRPVAVKEMKVPPGIPAAQADELRERTLREARAIAVLSHPNVITLHDVAREGDAPFVVMELLPSRSLAHLLRDHGPLTVEQAAAVGIAVAAALEAAHEAGITHRDVKPGNVLVAGDGRIKLTDFGIARNVSEATMTRTGIMLGSPAYISPEVASGGAVTPDADLWGLGATLFAAVEGAPPYDADGDPLETVGKVVNGKVPRPKPGPLADVITALMKKEPAKRISLREVRHRLYPMQNKAALDLFGPELFRTPDGKKTTAHLDATDTQVIKTVAPKPEGADQPAALAADPGPLPFLRGAGTGAAPAMPAPMPAPMPVPPPPVASAASRRGTRATVGLSVTAVLLFAIAVGGGFALARVASGQDLFPPKSQHLRQASAPGTPGAASTPLKFVPQQGNASSNANVTRDSQYTLSVPADWPRFIAARKSSFGASTVVQYVSPDGRQSLRLELIPKFFQSFSEKDAVEALKQSSSQDSLYNVRAPDRTSYGTELAFRTAERGQDRSSNPAAGIVRTTYGLLKQAGDSLWLLSLTTPGEQEEAGAKTFAQIEPTLAVAGS